MDIESRPNNPDLIYCSLCSFMSAYGDSLMIPFIRHLKPPKETDKNKGFTRNNQEKKSLLEEHDNDKNYIGNDPGLMSVIEDSAEQTVRLPPSIGTG